MTSANYTHLRDYVKRNIAEYEFLLNGDQLEDPEEREEIKRLVATL